MQDDSLHRVGHSCDFYWVVLCEVQNLGGICSSQLSALSQEQLRFSASTLGLCVSSSQFSERGSLRRAA